MRDDLPPDWPDEWAPPALSLGDALRALREEASRIIVIQKDLIATGKRRVPDERQLKRAIAMHRAESFLVKCRPYIDQVNGLIERLQIRGPRP